jgi:hypothetical protein
MYFLWLKFQDMTQKRVSKTSISTTLMYNSRRKLSGVSNNDYAPDSGKGRRYVEFSFSGLARFI